MHEKSERVAALAQYIAEELGADGTLAHRAGLLSRCDLMTNMVGEFASMQGIMGRYQATRDGEPAELAQAMDEFYMPRYSGDRLPQTQTGIALALAERLDTLVGIFGIGQRPTGDKDPFALRRAALGALRILREHSLALSLPALLQQAGNGLGGKLKESDTVEQVLAFMLERLKGIYTDSGIAVDLFQSVAAVRPETLADFEDRLRAVAAFRVLPEAEALAAANKRIGNILRKAESPIPDAIDTALLQDDAEQALHQSVVAMASQVTPLLENRDYAQALTTLAGLRETVDRFFDEVMVMVDEATVRANRLALLKQVKSLFDRIADVSKLDTELG